MTAQSSPCSRARPTAWVRPDAIVVGIRAQTPAVDFQKGILNHA